jgi:hypothetical protein
VRKEKAMRQCTDIPADDETPTVILTAHELDQMLRECSEFMADAEPPDEWPTDAEIAEFWRTQGMTDPFKGERA